MNNLAQINLFEYYLKTVEKRLHLCLEKGIPNWNIAIDLNLNKFGRKLAIEIYDKINLFKNEFGNTLMRVIFFMIELKKYF